MSFSCNTSKVCNFLSFFSQASNFFRLPCLAAIFSSVSLPPLLLLLFLFLSLLLLQLFLSFIYCFFLHTFIYSLSLLSSCFYFSSLLYCIYFASFPPAFMFPLLSCFYFPSPSLLLLFFQFPSFICPFSSVIYLSLLLLFCFYFFSLLLLLLFPTFLPFCSLCLSPAAPPAGAWPRGSPLMSIKVNNCYELFWSRPASSVCTTPSPTVSHTHSHTNSSTPPPTLSRFHSHILPQPTSHFPTLPPPHSPTPTPTPTPHLFRYTCHDTLIMSLY